MAALRQSMRRAGPSPAKTILKNSEPARRPKKDSRGGIVLVDRWTLAVCAARIFLFASFMTVAAVIPLLIDDWRIGAAKAGAIVTSFTVCYAVSLFAFAWAADHIGAKRAAAISAVASAVSSAAFGVFAHDWTSAFILYGLIGLSQGGVYTPLIMLFAERSAPEKRGTAMGWLIASTSIGYASSLFLSGLALGFGGYREAFLITGLAPTAGAVLLLICLRGTKNVIPVGTAALSFSKHVLGGREARLLTAGYTAHCWELLGSWAWLPSLVAAAFAMSGAGIAAASQSSAVSTGVMHVTGATASFAMGALSDRLGRRSVLLCVGGAGALLSLTIGWLVFIPVVLLVVLALVYSFLTIGDSPVLTTAITEVTERGHLGFVLAMRSLFGFGAGAIAPLAAGLVYDAAAAVGFSPAVDWGLTFGVIGIGGVIATACAARLGRAARPS